MEEKIINTRVMPRNEEHHEVVERMRNTLDQVTSVYVTTSGWVMVRFRDQGLRIAGVLPMDLSWLSGIPTEVKGFSTKPVERTSSQHVGLPIRYELHLRLAPIGADPHAIGHTQHDNPALLQKPVGSDGKTPSRRAVSRAGR